MCLIGLFLLGCTSKLLTPGANGTNITNATNATIANPASVYSVNHNGTSTIITNADGSQGGICMFPNGSWCEEWAYFRGECSPATVTANQTTNQTITTTPTTNISKMKESDFLVIDDSMPNLLTSSEPTAPPSN